MPCRMTDEERRLEVYETPSHYVEPLLEVVGSLRGQTVYEPCVGQGHIARYLRDCDLYTNDINLTLPATFHLDARLGIAWPLGSERVDWTITNPPFGEQLPILWRALQYSRNVAFLARLSFLEPTHSRTTLWSVYPPTDVIVLPRYSFRLNDAGKRQTDNVTCCWLIWREHARPCLKFSTMRPPRGVLPALDDRDDLVEGRAS